MEDSEILLDIATVLEDIKANQETIIKQNETLITLGQSQNTCTSTIGQATDFLCTNFTELKEVFFTLSASLIIFLVGKALWSFFINL